MPPRTLVRTRIRQPPLAAAHRVQTAERGDVMLWAIIAHVVLSVAHVNAMFPFLLPLRPAIWSILLAGGLYLANPIGQRNLGRLTRQRGTKLVLALLLWGAVTMPFAVNYAEAFFFLKDKFFKTVVMFVLIVGIVRGPKDVERCALGYCVGTVLYSIYALVNRATLLGVDWRFAGMRLGGYDANDFAVFCVSGVPLAIYFVLRGRGPARIAALIGLYTLGAAIVLSGSRGGFLAAGATGVFILFRFRSIRWWGRAIGVAAVVAAVAFTATDQYWDKMKTINSADDYNRETFGRLGVWKRGIGYAVQFPLTGVGAANFNFAEARVSEELRRMRDAGKQTPRATAHSAYVQVLAELGFPGAVIFVSLLLAAWLGMTRAEGSGLNPELRGLMQAMKASLLGMMVGIVFLSHAYSPMLYALLAMATAAGKIATTIPTNARRARRGT